MDIESVCHHQRGLRLHGGAKTSPSQSQPVAKQDFKRKFPPKRRRHKNLFTRRFLQSKSSSLSEVSKKWTGLIVSGGDNWQERNFSNHFGSVHTGTGLHAARQSGFQKETKPEIRAEKSQSVHLDFTQSSLCERRNVTSITKPKHLPKFFSG